MRAAPTAMAALGCTMAREGRSAVRKSAEGHRDRRGRWWVRVGVRAGHVRGEGGGTVVRRMHCGEDERSGWVWMSVESTYECVRVGCKGSRG